MLDHAVIFEEVGVDGKRFVCLADAKEVDSDEYDGHWTGKIKALAPTQIGTSVEESLQSISE